MDRSARFWVLMAIFQVVFGIVVFAITRQIYIADPSNSGSEVATNSGQRVSEWLSGNSEVNPAISNSPGSLPTITNPVEISRQATEYFDNKQYAKAADLYEQLLALGPNDSVIHNNLGITLHYIGRSTEAIRRLNEGIALDPSNQRIWLTLGFVNSQLGNIEDARVALTKALEMGVDTDVGQSADRMLKELP